jgi:hypothetical protein
MTRKRQIAIITGLFVALAFCSPWVHSRLTEANKQTFPNPVIVVDPAHRKFSVGSLPWANDFTTPRSITLDTQALKMLRSFQEPPSRPTAAVEPMLLFLTVLWARNRWNPFRSIVAIGTASIVLVIETRRHLFGSAQFLVVLAVFAVLLRTSPSNRPKI